MTTKHTNLKNKTLVILSRECVIWPNETGVARSMTGDRIISYGKKGSPDIIGFVKRTGKFIGIEIKIPPDDLRPEQIIFKDISEKNGAMYFVIRCAEDADRILNFLKSDKPTDR